MHFSMDTRSPNWAIRQDSLGVISNPSFCFGISWYGTARNISCVSVAIISLICAVPADATSDDYVH